MILNRWESESNKHSISNCSGMVAASSRKKRGLRSVWVYEICVISKIEYKFIISLYCCFFNQGCNCILNFHPKIFLFSTDSLYLIPYLILIIISLILFIGREKIHVSKKNVWPETVPRFNTLQLMYANSIEDTVYSRITIITENETLFLADRLLSCNLK